MRNIQSSKDTEKYNSLEFLQEKIYNFPTKNPRGFNSFEIAKLLEYYPKVNNLKFHETLYGCTGTTDENGFITYHIDVYHALLCGLENRDLRPEEWD